jgi:hypothetical protein
MSWFAFPFSFTPEFRHEADGGWEDVNFFLLFLLVRSILSRDMEKCIFGYCVKLGRQSQR